MAAEWLSVCKTEKHGLGPWKPEVRSQGI